MNKICTDIEQSKKLKELGIDRRTSDMFYWCGTALRIGGYRAQDKEFDIPAWSLAALLAIIKPINENTYTIKGTLDGGAIISFEEVTTIMYQEEEIIDAVFRMVVWLLENKKL